MTELCERSVVYAPRPVCLICIKFLLLPREIRAYFVHTRVLIDLRVGVRRAIIWYANTTCAPSFPLPDRSILDNSASVSSKVLRGLSYVNDGEYHE